MPLRRSRVNASASTVVATAADFVLPAVPPAPSRRRPRARSTRRPSSRASASRCESLPARTSPSRCARGVARSNGLRAAALLTNPEGETLLEVACWTTRRRSCTRLRATATQREAVVRRRCSASWSKWRARGCARTRPTPRGSCRTAREPPAHDDAAPRIESLLCRRRRPARSGCCCAASRIVHGGVPQSARPAETHDHRAALRGETGWAVRWRGCRKRARGKLVRVTVEEGAHVRTRGHARGAGAAPPADGTARPPRCWCGWRRRWRTRLFARRRRATRADRALFASARAARWSTAQEIATAMETAMLVALQLNAEFFRARRGHGRGGAARPAVGFVRDAARAAPGARCRRRFLPDAAAVLDVVGLDWCRSEGAALTRMRSVWAPTITKTPFQSRRRRRRTADLF